MVAQFHSCTIWVHFLWQTVNFHTIYICIVNCFHPWISPFLQSPLLFFSPLFMSHKILSSSSLLFSSTSLQVKNWSFCQFSFHPIFKTSIVYSPEYHFLLLIFSPLCMSHNIFSFGILLFSSTTLQVKQRSNLLKKILCLLHFHSSSGDLQDKTKAPHLHRSWLVAQFWFLNLFGKLSFVNLSAERKTD